MNQLGQNPRSSKYRDAAGGVENQQPTPGVDEAYRNDFPRSPFGQAIPPPSPRFGPFGPHFLIFDLVWRENQGKLIVTRAKSAPPLATPASKSSHSRFRWAKPLGPCPTLPCKEFPAIPVHRNGPPAFMSFRVLNAPVRQIEPV